MQKICFLTVLLLTLSLPHVFAQKDTLILENKKEVIRNEEKEKLKKEVLSINKQYEDEVITFEEAEKLKKEAAARRAEKIEERIARLEKGDASETVREIKPARRTESIFVFAAGINNTLQSGRGLNNSDYKVWGSRFAELGIAGQTRLMEDNNFARINYGISFQFNGLKPTDNRYFVNNNKLIELQKYPVDLRKSKLNYYNLVFPVHFEFGPSRRIEKKGRYVYDTEKQFKVGIGGYAGLNIGARQKLKYNHEGKIKKEKLKGDYQLNDFVYGLSGYVGFGETSFYIKYDLNPLFKSPNLQQNNISMGVRFDFK